MKFNFKIKFIAVAMLLSRSIAITQHIRLGIKISTLQFRTGFDFTEFEKGIYTQTTNIVII